MKSTNLVEMAPIILAEIKKAKSVLLSCHPSPDPDCVGSALAMKFAIESLGIKATVIKGDSEIPQGFMHFPGAKDIVMKNFGEVDLKDYDLYIAADIAAVSQVSRVKPVVFPLPIKSIVIDHHPSNTGFADMNLIVPESPATAQVIYLLAKEWGMNISSEMAANIFVGIYTDTGGLKYSGTTIKTYEIMTDLVSKCPDFSLLIQKMENSESPDKLTLYGLALGSIEVFLNNSLAISTVSNADLVTKKIAETSVSTSIISSMMKVVDQWKIVASLIELEPNKIKCSFRTNDVENYPVGPISSFFGGGGHKAAAGAIINASLEEAKKLIVAKAKELYNL